MTAILPRRLHRARSLLALAALLALATGGTIAVHTLRSGPGQAAAEGVAFPPVQDAPAAIPPHVPRLVWEPVLDSTIARVADFTLLGDTLVVLDPRTTQVVLLREHDGVWRQIGGFGRRGGGPGELLRPIALAAVGDSAIAVFEMGGRTQRFRPNGALLGAERAPLPCPMYGGELAYGDGGVRYLAGLCAGTGPAQDTIFVALFRAVGDGDYEELARLPRVALDLSWGSILAARHPLAEHRDEVQLSMGIDACLHRLPREPGSARQQAACTLARERLRAPVPPEVLQVQAAARQRGEVLRERSLRWPDALPVHMGLLPRGDSLFLMRPVNIDSLVVVPAGAPFVVGEARLAAPLQPLVGCRRNACLWFDANEARLALLR